MSMLSAAVDHVVQFTWIKAGFSSMDEMVADLVSRKVLIDYVIPKAASVKKVGKKETKEVQQAKPQGQCFTLAPAWHHCPLPAMERRSLARKL